MFNLSWSVTGVGASCVVIVVMNGFAIPLQEEVIAGGRCGEGGYDRTASFSIPEELRNKVPPEITITAQLRSGLGPLDSVLDSESTTLTVRNDCPPPGFVTQ
jgi:hypothetical protein